MAWKPEQVWASFLKGVTPTQLQTLIPHRNVNLGLSWLPFIHDKLIIFCEIYRFLKIVSVKPLVREILKEPSNLIFTLKNPIKNILWSFPFYTEETEAQRG